MVIKIHGTPQTTCTRRVMAVCEEAGVPYELVPVNFASAEHQSAAHLKKQPFGQVPYMVDGDFSLFESRAIARYIAAKSNSPLLPPASDLHAWSRFEQAASVEVANFDPFASGIVMERVFKPQYDQSTDEERAAKLTETLAKKLEGLVDLFHLPYGELLPKGGVDFLEDEQRFPNIARWWKELRARPAWITVNSIE